MPDIETKRERKIALPKSYKYIVTFAAKHSGVFSFSEYARHLDKDVFTPEKYGDRAVKLREQELKWKRTSIGKMLDTGVFTRLSDDAFRLEPEIMSVLKNSGRPKKAFSPGANHIKLLKLNRNGVISPEALGSVIKAKNLPEAERQLKIQKGMIKNLADNGFLEKRVDGSFLLTPKAALLLQEDFTAGYSDLALLKLQNGGVIKADTLEKALKGDDAKKAKERLNLERKLKDLADGGFAVKDGRDYTLTPKAFEFIKSAKDNAEEQKVKTEKGGIKLYSADSVFLWLSQNDRFSIADVEAQADSGRIKKRLSYLISRNFIREDKKDAFILTAELKDRLRVLKAEKAYRPSKLDTEFLELAKGGWRIDKADIAAHPQNAALQKRLVVLLDRRLIREEFGGYTLTEDLAGILKKKKSRGSFSVTRFDTAFRDISEGGRFTRGKLLQHPRAKSLEKRLETLKAHDMIKELPDGNFELSETFLDRLRAAEIMGIDRSVSLDTFSKEEKDMLRDMGVFSQLTEWQIYCYIYGRRRELMNGDIRRLLSKRIIEYDTVQKVYTPTRYGTIFALQLSGKERYYKSKAKSRPEEIAHDVLVYEAYRDMMRKMETEGCEITKIETDREMRSRINSVPMGTAVFEQIPDLRLYIKTPDGKEDYRNIEIDCGYSSATVERKISGLAHNGSVYWYAKNEHSAARAVKAAAKLGFKVARDTSENPHTVGLKAAKTLYVSVVSEDMSVHKIPFKEGRRFNAFAKQKHPA